MFRPFLPGGIAYALPMLCLWHSMLFFRRKASRRVVCIVPYRRGACQPVSAEFRRHLPFSGVGGAPVSGGAPALQARRALAVPCGGACFLCCLPTLPLVFVFPPIPPTPFPDGEGGDQGYFHARGFAPCIPGAGWDTALALLVENRFLRLRMERWHPPGRREPGLQKAATAVHLYGRVYKCRKRFSAGVPGAKPPAK